MPTSTRKKRPFYGGLPAKPRSFSILRRRGGRPCPPAGNARFYGNPMRNRNIFNGPMWASAPTNGHENSTNFEGRTESSARRKMPFFTENQCEIATFSMGRCRHRPLQTATKIQRILKGGQSRPPLQTGYGRPCGASIFIRRILAATTVFPAQEIVRFCKRRAHS